MPPSCTGSFQPGEKFEIRGKKEGDKRKIKQVVTARIGACIHWSEMLSVQLAAEIRTFPVSHLERKSGLRFTGEERRDREGVACADPLRWVKRRLKQGIDPGVNRLRKIPQIRVDKSPMTP
jgi:hypothetical protein